MEVVNKKLLVVLEELCHLKEKNLLKKAKVIMYIIQKIFPDIKIERIKKWLIKNHDIIEKVQKVFLKKIQKKLSKE